MLGGGCFTPFGHANYFTHLNTQCCTRYACWYASGTCDDGFLAAASQAMGKKLQNQLWERAQERGFARSNGPLATACMDLLVEELSKREGRMGAGVCAPGEVPESLFQRANTYAQVRGG